MVSTTTKQWPECTADDPLKYGDPVGLDLFDHAVNGEAVTAIYVRFACGRRWPARTVSRTDAARHDEILASWDRKYGRDGTRSMLGKPPTQYMGENPFAR
jgi:hypothetical protein